MITNSLHRITLIVLNTFLSITAVAGGVGLISGWITLPVEWLHGSPFRSYTIPGLVLLVVVGGGGLIATVTIWRRHELAALLSIVAGTIIMCFEVVEVLVVGSEAGLMRSLQIFYFGLGLLIVLVAAPVLSRHRPLIPALHD